MPVNSDLSQQVNIGKNIESKLLQVGIDSFKKLQSTGSQKAWLMLHALDAGACINELYALEGALKGIRWHNLTNQEKQELKLFFDRVKKDV
jgi:DNA transformation protein